MWFRLLGASLESTCRAGGLVMITGCPATFRGRYTGPRPWVHSHLCPCHHTCLTPPRPLPTQALDPTVPVNLLTVPGPPPPYLARWALLLPFPGLPTVCSCACEWWLAAHLCWGGLGSQGPGCACSHVSNDLGYPEGAS